MSVNVAPINRDLAAVRVVDDDTKESQLIGMVRRNLSGEWFPELPPQRLRQVAVRDLVQAHVAMQWYAKEMTG